MAVLHTLCIALKCVLCFQISGRYPWILLGVFQLLLTNVSLLGHLCGILSGFACEFCALKENFVCFIFYSYVLEFYIAILSVSIC